MTLKYFQMMSVVLVLGLFAICVANGHAQDSTVFPPRAVSSSSPQLPSGVSQILQLEKAEVGDSTIIAYIKRSNNSFDLDADQIIYLRQQGVSDAVITTMLSQPRLSIAMPSSSAPPITTQTPVNGTQTVPPATTVTYLQTAPPIYYYQPYYYPYYPTYSCIPALSLSFAWGSGYHGGYYSGWHGGWHR